MLLRYGTCVDFLFPNALITSPNADSERLMFCASFRRSPVASVLPTRSLRKREGEREGSAIRRRIEGEKGLGL